MWPAPKVFERQEIGVWVSLAACWALGGFVAWLSATLIGGGQATGGLVALMGLAVALISIALRLPTLSDPPATSVAADHLVWLLGISASLSWLGFLVLSTADFMEALPAMSIVLAAEVWLTGRAIHDHRIPWVWRLTEPRAVPGLKRDDDSERKLCAELDAALPAGAEEPEAPLRSTYDGVGEDGRRFMSGLVSVEFGEEQREATVVVGFCPAFVGEPQVDLECESDDACLRVVNCTPSGMRLAIRRNSTLSAEKIHVGWYAVEVELGDCSQDAPRGLP